MALRNTPFITGQIYHVFNRSIDRKPIFTQKKDADRTLSTLSFYRFINVPVRLSHFLKWSVERRNQLLNELVSKDEILIKIICFCLMPTHFHLLLQQDKDGGISKFLGQFQNSFTRYFNTKNKRVGHLFKGQFKAVRIETEEQLLHVSRYIHLNPYSSYVIKSTDDLPSYQWSSFPEYIGLNEGFCDKDIILSQFNDRSNYRNFVFDQADYQRELESIKHLVLED